MRRTQEAQVIPVTGNVISCGLDSVVVIDKRSLSRQLEQLAQLADHLLVATFLEAVGTHELRWPSSSAASKALSARSTA